MEEYARPKYLCLDCGETINNLNPIYDKRYDEYVDQCPYCKSTNIREINYCLICGEEIEDDNEDLCEECNELEG